MKANKKRSITMILLREADKPVRYSRFSRKLLYTTLCLIISIIVAISGWQFDLHRDSSKTIDNLSHQISKHDSVYNQMVSNKDTIIQDLKSEIVQLTEKTSSLQTRYEEMETLKEQVMKLLDQVEQSGASVAVSKASTITVLSQSSSAGGEEITPTKEQWDQFLEDSHAAIASLEDDMEAVSEQLDTAKSGLKELLHQLKTTPDHWPTSSGTVTSEYGIRSDPFSGMAAFHGGIDIAGDMYDPVFAAADGVVSEAGWDAAKGNYVRIRHRSNLETVYMHLSTIEVQQDDRVEKGQRIAKLGNTGRSTGPHLHFEILVSGKEVNPFNYLN